MVGTFLNSRHAFSSKTSSPAVPVSLHAASLCRGRSTGRRLLAGSACVADNLSLWFGRSVVLLLQARAAGMASAPDGRGAGAEVDDGAVERPQQARAQELVGAWPWAVKSLSCRLLYFIRSKSESSQIERAASKEMTLPFMAIRAALAARRVIQPDDGGHGAVQEVAPVLVPGRVRFTSGRAELCTLQWPMAWTE